MTLDYGVAQGSILGPKLLNIYTRSVPCTMQAASFSEGYADDHQLQKQFNLMCQVNVLGKGINKSFQIIESWMKELFLKLNSSKTKIMVAAPSSVRKEIIINGTFIGDRCVRFVDCAKNLGVLLDSELSLNIQISKVVSVSFNTIQLLSRIKSFLNYDQLWMLVSSLVFSNILYYGLTAQTISKLQIAQNSAARLVCQVNRFDNVRTEI